MMKVIVAFQHKLEKTATIRNIFETNVIKLFTWSKYFHVEVVVDDIWMSSGPTHGGAFKHKLKPLNYDRYDYIELEVSDEYLSDVQKFIDDNVGTGYDWLGVYLAGLGMNAHDPKKWFCSEIVAKILKLFGVGLTKPSNIYSPGSLYKELQHIKLNKLIEKELI